MSDDPNVETDEALDALLAQTRDAVLAADQPPDRLRDAAMRALTWDTDMETLLATFDSAKETAGMRSATATRDLVFGGDGITVEVSVAEEASDGTVLTGSIGGEITEATLVQPGKPDQTVSVDEYGRFRVPVTGSMAGLVVTTTDGRRIRTELFSLDPTASGD